MMILVSSVVLSTMLGSYALPILSALLVGSLVVEYCNVLGDKQ